MVINKLVISVSVIVHQCTKFCGKRTQHRQVNENLS